MLNLQEFLLEDSLLPSALYKINASICQLNEENWCAYRIGNLDEYDAQNYLTKLNHSFEPIAHIKLKGNNGNTAFEDVRLFVYKAELIALYTYLPKVGEDSWEFAYGVGLGVVNRKNGNIIKQQSLRKYSKTLHSKNWVPYIHNEELYIVTDFSPHLRILRASGNPGNFSFRELLVNDAVHWDYGQIRGGTPFFTNSNQKWLYSFVHSHIFLPNGIGKIKYYLYTIVRLCPESKVIQIGNKYLQYSTDEQKKGYKDIWLSATRNTGMKVVFPMGVIKYPDGVLLSYGKDDCISRMKYYSWDFIHSLFDTKQGQKL